MVTVNCVSWDNVFFKIPKGMDSLRVIDSGRVLWLNVTGSGNETSAHVQQNPRMSIDIIGTEIVEKNIQ
jgi:hypothetical protein